MATRKKKADEERAEKPNLHRSCFQILVKAMLRKRSFSNPYECPSRREERSMSAPGSLLMDSWPFRPSLKLHPSRRKSSTGDGPREGELEDLHEDEPFS